MTDYSNFVVPEVLEDIDIDTIHTRMLNQLPPNIDKTEGGFAYDMTRPSAMEKSDIMTIMIEVIKLFFPEWSYGVFLDMLARPCGIRRRDATPAVATLHITGMAGTIIPQGFGFATSGTAISESIFYESMEEATIANNGEVDVMVKCTETGTVGNVPSDCIILMTVPIPAITGVTNLDPATGGTEVEDDETLRNRIMEYDRGRNGSYTGCDADYKRWAMQIDGVGSCAVIPEWKGKGTGTVKLIIMDSNGEPANETILANVYNYIISMTNRDLRLAPIGAILTVETATAVNISISASIHLENDANIDAIEEAYTDAIQQYFSKAKAENYVRYTRIGSILSETPGVLDYESLTLNNGSSNVAIYVDHYPVLVSVSLTDANAPDPDPDQEPDPDPDPEESEEGGQEGENNG